ncbi:MAG: bifunctional (p)ppGpp synthetase/guanosine-3',5'-bis(diphosphate) 3'-pyrophosphohydrolase [Lachnospiraceae bacterium]|nr:bifunctional (p)ppGpp synthetase/guanosine-3',5'-bis(diphosphate) 3'-pyrophosphohydrolase [Lachnospiraceae bacterium]
MAEPSIINANKEFERDSRHIEKDISTPADFTDSDILYEQLIECVLRYHPNTDISMIEKAYRIAKKAHEGQFRKSGEPYIAHPVCVAIILAKLELDKETIVAGILHDVVEDTIMTREEIATEFNEEIALLVDGVTKLTQLDISTDKVEVQAENLRKMFLAMAKDIRVILIKLADRLHNLRTLQYMKPHKQIEKSRETLDIYSPIAHRLGISRVKIELDDLALKYLEPDVYEFLEQGIALRKADRQDFINSIVDEVGEHMKTAGIEAEVDGRVKHYLSIYKKMKNQNKTLDQIYDLFAVRIKVDTVQDCYAALGIIHEMYTPIPGRFKDYIAMPKPNMYQSLHTTLIGHNGTPFEIQIRTYEMHKVAEYGIAAHWKYKENLSGSDKDQEEAKLSWLRQILEWQKDSDDNAEFMSIVKSDLNLFTEQVYCFTPSGDVKSLPRGSTPIDFAYAIHSAVGNQMVGARINGQQATIDQKLQNGDRVEIITSANSVGPSRDWLKLCVSTQAKSKINQWFKHEYKEENIVHGKELLAEYCKGKNIDFSKYNSNKYKEKVQIKYGFRDWDSVLAAIGHGGLKEGQVVTKMIDEYDKDHPRILSNDDIIEEIESGSESKKTHKSKAAKGITVHGLHDVSVRFSKCCSPVPGDEIVGFITRGRGISIHRTDCINLQAMDEEDRARLIEAEWDKKEQEQSGDKYEAEIKVYAYNQKNMLMNITKLFSEENVTLTALNARVIKQEHATYNICFETSGTEEINRLANKIRNIEGVIDVERTSG